MFGSGNCGEKSLSWILNILKFPSFYSGNFKFLKNAPRQIIPNCSTNHAITTINSYKWLPMIRTSIFWTLSYFELSFLSLRIFSLVNSNSELVWLELPWKKKSCIQGLGQAERQILHRTTNRIYLLRQPCLFSFGKNPHQTSDMATISAAKYKCSFFLIEYPISELAQPFMLR